MCFIIVNDIFIQLLILLILPSFSLDDGKGRLQKGTAMGPKPGGGTNVVGFFFFLYRADAEGLLKRQLNTPGGAEGFSNNRLT